MARKLKKFKVGIDSETLAISLVEEPAIEENFIALNKQEEEKILLARDEKHIVYGAVLVPEREIYRNDGEREYYLSFTTDSIEKMSQDFMKEYRQKDITLDHSDMASEVYVVESWLKTDPYKDKSVALGLNDSLPVGTWFCGMKVNNIDTWERIKSGELNGFSVESLVSLEEFEKNNSDMVDNENFWTRLKGIINEALGKNATAEEELAEEIKEQETQMIETELEENEPVETPPVETKPEEPAVTPPEPKEEPVEPANEPEDEPKEEPKQEDNHLEELIRNLNEEIKALKEMNEGLQEKVKDLGKVPSAKPVKTNAKPKPDDTYAAWRKQMAEYIR